MSRITFSARAQRTAMQGLTLVELLVAMVLMSLVTLATVALYQVNSQGYRTVDSSQTLDDNARFVFEVISQSIRNAAYREVVAPGTPASNSAANVFDSCANASAAALQPCPVLGFDNSNVATLTSDTDFGGAGRNSPNSSDSLAIRFSGSGTGDTGDRTMVGCSGGTTPVATSLATMSLSLFWIRNAADGEPELVCTSRVFTGGVASRTTQSLARGVESLQVVYGVDIDATPDGVPDRWVSAANVTDWTRVLALRVGLVMRGDSGSSQVRSAGNLYPLGQDFIGTSTETGFVFASPSDNRLRRTYTATFKYRNEL